MLSGLVLNVLLLSSHTFVIVTSVFSVTLSGLNVFVITPFLIDFSYKSNFAWSLALTTASSIVYVILLPFASYTGKFLNVYVQLSFSVTSCSATTVSPFFTCSFIDVNVFAFAASLSMFSHAFVAVT